MAARLKTRARGHLKKDRVLLEQRVGKLRRRDPNLTRGRLKLQYGDLYQQLRKKHPKLFLSLPTRSDLKKQRLEELKERVRKAVYADPLHEAEYYAEQLEERPWNVADVILELHRQGELERRIDPEQLKAWQYAPPEHPELKDVVEGQLLELIKQRPGQTLNWYSVQLGRNPKGLDKRVLWLEEKGEAEAATFPGRKFTYWIPAGYKLEMPPPGSETRNSGERKPRTDYTELKQKLRESVSAHPLENGDYHATAVGKGSQTVKTLLSTMCKEGELQRRLDDRRSYVYNIRPQYASSEDAERAFDSAVTRNGTMYTNILRLTGLSNEQGLQAYHGLVTRGILLPTGEPPIFLHRAPVKAEERATAEN